MEIIPTSLSIKKNYKIFLFNKSEKNWRGYLASYLDKNKRSQSIILIFFKKTSL